ncbi:hypothetical protein FIBSPDRAFT_877133 [Athelia psychrophila]|uniref:Uncharacterized protein n=1 Tax=Athelia psychrophila TaxID=1759441 RepID=A0A167W7X4_9AGAM|nr:hypothetical protein FIBSPDRAFT_877133 [Fibularhizoctonia sp. CBS 109695]
MAPIQTTLLKDACFAVYENISSVFQETMPPYSLVSDHPSALTFLRPSSPSSANSPALAGVPPPSTQSNGASRDTTPTYSHTLYDDAPPSTLSYTGAS